MKRTISLLVLACLLVSHAPAEHLRLRWNELAPAVTGKKVWLRADGRVKIVGTVEAVEPAALKVQVTKTSDRKTYPKGQVSIPRPALSTIQVGKPHGHKGLLIGAAAGVGVATVAGATGGARGLNEGYLRRDTLAATMAGMVVIGTAVGWLADTIAHHGGKRVTLVAD